MNSDYRLENQIQALKRSISAALRCQVWLLQNWDEIPPERRAIAAAKLSIYLAELNTIRPRRS